MELNTTDVVKIYQTLQTYDYDSGDETTDFWALSRYLRDIYSRLEKLENNNELPVE